MFKKTQTGGVVIALLAMLAGCASVNVSEPSACKTQSVSFPVASSVDSQFPAAVQAQGVAAFCQLTPAQQAAFGAPSSYTIPAQSTTSKFDFSDAVSKVDSVATNLDVAVNQLLLDNLQGDFNFVSSMEVDVQGTDTTNFPKVVLATYVAPANASTEINFNVVLPADELLAYLKSGQVVLTFTLGSSTITLAQACALAEEGTLNDNAHVCVSVSGTVSKGL